MTPIIVVFIILFLLLASSAAGDDDVACLRAFKSSISSPDPIGPHINWNFSSSISPGFICSFAGVSCWNEQENRVISLSLNSFNISGHVPSALRLCSSLTSLDLSHNSLSGPIPPSLCTWLPYLVALDLSSNSLTGPIPPELSGCQYLNNLNLSSNMLSGSIPPSLSTLSRLQRLDLSSNHLSGPIPAALSRFGASSFHGNPLLGSSSSPRSRVVIVVVVDLVAGLFGFLLSVGISYLVWRFFFSAKSKAKRLIRMTKKAKVSPIGLVRVSLFQDPMEELMLADLMAAAGDFHPDNVVVAGNSVLGTSYRAVLWDGSALIVKKLCECKLSEWQLRAEIRRVGQIRHPNLVPLLGFCFLEEEKLLIYKDMANGALSSKLQFKDESLDWPTRLRIGIGTARGLAWLHHGFPVPLVHQSLSSSAVLLDEDYEPRITDFGLAVLHGSDGSSSSSTETDVFEFGVVLFELATDGDVVEGQGFNLASSVLWLSAAGRIQEAMGQSLRGRGHDDQIVQFLAVACSCVVARPEERPSMYEVYESLKSIGGLHQFSEQFDEFQPLYNT